jgi:prevent-host-death family protein
LGFTENVMKLKEDIKPVSYMKTRAAELLKKVNDSRRPTIITQNGEARAVLLDIGSYEALRDATLLLQLASQGEKDFEQGRFLPQDEALARVRSRLRER